MEWEIEMSKNLLPGDIFYSRKGKKYVRVARGRAHCDECALMIKGACHADTRTDCSDNHFVDADKPIKVISQRTQSAIKRIALETIAEQKKAGGILHQ